MLAATAVIATCSNGGEMLTLLVTANLVSRCGEPCPEDTTVRQVESLQQALQTITGSQLDAVPHSNWDKAFTRAFRECRQALSRQCGLFGRLFFGNSIRKRRMRIEDLVERLIRQSPLASKLAAADQVVVVSHLAEMLNVVSLVLDAKRTAEWPLIIKAADYALKGYLPVDFERTVESQQVLVY
jgi:hypothetical protein